MAGSSFLDSNFMSKKLKFEEYTAQLDARTGAWFTKELKAHLKLGDIEPEIKDKLKEVYFDS